MTRYGERVPRHAEAFIGHATGFWLTVGGEPSNGASWLHHTSRATRAPALLHRVIYQAADDFADPTRTTG